MNGMTYFAYIGVCFSGVIVISGIIAVCSIYGNNQCNYTDTDDEPGYFLSSSTREPLV